MATEMVPGVFTAVFAKQATKGRATGAAALTQLALAVERQMKLDLAVNTHKYGTATTATRHGPPALISGTLRRSITHTRPAPGLFGWEVRVGVAGGFYPPYPKKGTRTASSEYARYLELDPGLYPFMAPAFRKVIDAGGVAQIGRLMTADWQRRP
jgi:hypothetical protein